MEHATKARVDQNDTNLELEVMFDDLPTPIRQQILSYLETNNFRAAKELRDSFLYKINKKAHQDQDNSFDDDEEEDDEKF